MTLLLYILIVIIGIVLILIFAAPKNYNVSRSITINKPISEVFSYLKFTKNQDQWSPWKKRDPGMKQTFTGTDGEVGFVSRWESDHKHVGHGEQEIKSIDENKRIVSELRFLKPFSSTSRGFFDVHEVDKHETKVTWGFYGKHKVPMNVMMLFFNMDKAVGKDFEEGLADLKELMES